MKAYLEPIEIEKLEKATTNLRDRLLIRMLFRLGCRVSEALGLEVKDIDLNLGTVTIEHLKALTADLVWTMTGGAITLDNACLTTPGARTYEKGEATMRRDNVFTGQGISISP